MGALPKNKITRAERGKRRRGNSPKLKRDLHSAIPSHKKGFMAELLKFVGLETQAAVATAESKAAKRAAKVKKSVTNLNTNQGQAMRQARGTQTVKATRITQHKG
jgi:hypothetical protein